MDDKNYPLCIWWFDESSVPHLCMLRLTSDFAQASLLVVWNIKWNAKN